MEGIQGISGNIDAKTLKFGICYLWTTIDTSNTPPFSLTHLHTGLIWLKIEGTLDKSGNIDARALYFGI